MRDAWWVRALKMPVGVGSGVLPGLNAPALSAAGRRRQA
ncbi:hypothetical protein PATSB16_26590 [Pandoraea thiooxydans]|nr:hypothetical protein PATSB16_26590 [Pandoraea thiooxydans]